MKGRILLIVGFMLIYSSTLYARTSGTYFGVGLARATYYIDPMTFETLPYSYVFTGKPIFFTASQDNATTNTSWSMYAGYQFNRYFSLEALYQPLGEYTRSGSNRGLVDPNLTHNAGLGTQVSMSISDTDRLKLQGYALTAVGSYPVADYIYLLGKVGAFYWDATLERSTTFSSSTLNKTWLSKETDSGFSPIFGVGLRIDVSRSLSVRGEWSRISNIGGGLSTGSSYANITSFSAQINF
jgi:OOP family OmpA-OmpF porin